MDYGGGSQKNNKLMQWSSHILTSILRSHMMVTKKPQNVHRKCFWTILVTFIFDVKIDVNICEPHVNLFFLWTSSIVSVFDLFDIFLTFWHLFRWFKFTLKPPNSMARGNFFSAIWDTSHWNFVVKFGLNETLWHLLGLFLVNFDICQFLATPGPFE